MMNVFNFIFSSSLEYSIIYRLPPEFHYKYNIFYLRSKYYIYNCALNKFIQAEDINGLLQILNDFKVKYGASAYQAISMELQRGFTDQASSPMEESLIQRKTQRILRTFFPEQLADEPHFCESASPGHLRSLIESAGTFSTGRIDRALYDLFQRTAVFQPESSESRKLALLCIDRLARKGHDREFRSYLEKQIQRKKADETIDHEDQARQIEALEICLKQLVN